MPSIVRGGTFDHLKTGSRVETLRFSIVLRDREAKLRDVARGCNALRDFDHVHQQLRANAAALKRGQHEPRVLILRMRQVLAMDATGLEALEDFARRFQAHGKHLVLCGPHSQPLMAMHRHGFIEWLGEENVRADMQESLKRAEELMAKG